MKASKLLSALFVLYSTCSYAQEDYSSLEDYISKNKKDQFSYDYEKNDAESSKLRDSWIAPVNLSYSYSRTNPYSSEQTSQSAAIKMSQPIFRSGGIYYGIKYAQASKKYADYSVDVAKRKLIKDAVSLLMQIKRSELSIAKQNLQIKNAEIKLEQNKEQYLSGRLDSGFLDNAIIEKNVVSETLFDLESSKEKLISQFKAISDSNYEVVKIPHLELLNKKQFLEHNIVLKLANSDVSQNRYSKNVTIAKYLPSVAFNAGYNWSKSENQLFTQSNGERDYYNYGISVNMPLDINTFRDIESSRVSYLKSKIAIDDKKRELLALFEQVMQNIDNFEKKIALSKENMDLYSKLLDDTKQLYDSGYKTTYDVELLENSVKISKLDLKIFELDKQLELLSLYEMYVNEI